MKTLSLCLFFLGASVRGPAVLSAQESLLTRSFGNSRIIYSVAFSPDGKYLVSGGVDNALKLWNLEDGSAVRTFKGHRNFVNSVAFSPDGKKLASAGEDGTVRVWSVEDGTCVNTFKGHADSVWSVAFFPDGERVASGSTDGTIKLWRLASGKPYKTINGRSGYVYSVSVSSDGKYIASGGAGRAIKVWDAETGARKLSLEGHAGAVNSVAFSRTGEYLVSGSDDGTAKVWRLKDGVCLKTFSSGRQPVLAVAYAPGGGHVFSGGGDRVINVCNLSNGGIDRVFAGHSGSVKSLAVAPDGKYLASGSFDKTIKLWLTPWEAEARNKEIQKAAALEAEKNKNYALHYEEGLRLLAAPTLLNLRKAPEEFRLALTFKQDPECEAKLAEASGALLRKEQDTKRLAKLGGVSLLALFSAFAAWRIVSGAKKKAGLRATLPGEIKKETMSGNYENAFRHYAKYKEIGGDPGRLPRDEMMELYRGMRILEELPAEKLPYNFFLAYAVAFTKEGNHKMAQSVLRSGKLLDQFTGPGDFEAFVGMYDYGRRPEYLLGIKLGPGAYSGLAEAFFKAGDYDYCGKMCAFKKQFHAKEVTPRDSELLAACQKRAEEAAAQDRKAAVKWHCINCGYIHGAQEAPEACPTCGHPRAHFKAVAEV